jgi:GNAT superfamily N-acetyltransferase
MNTSAQRAAVKQIKRPEIRIDVFECPTSEKARIWNLFKKEHYLTSDINKAARCFVACWEGVPVGFSAVLAMPSGTVKNAWRGHRLVVLSDYQGLGIGNRLSEWVAQRLIDDGKRFFSKTANIKLGLYRDNSPRWKKTTKHKKKLSPKDMKNDNKALINTAIYIKRVCFTHEYVG